MFSTVVAAEKPSPQARLEWWIQDLEFFARTFPDVQVDFPKLYNSKKFRKEIDQLELAIPRVSDSEIVLRLMRLVATGRVAHISVYPQADLKLHPYPVRFFWYSDGPAVTNAKEEYKSGLGARIVRIGSMTPEQLEAAVAPYLSHENTPWLHALSPDFMLTQEVAEHFGLSAPDGSIELSLVRPTGEPLQLHITPAADYPTLLSAAQARSAPVSLMNKRPGEAYWYEYLADSHALYIQYNRCMNDRKKWFLTFTRELFGFVDGLPPSQHIDRVIIDLRSNRGGDSRVVEPLVEGLLARRELAARGHLYVLTSRYTFSAGMMAAVELRDRLHAIVVGEPSGSPPNEYAAVDSFVLPNSKIEVEYAKRYIRLLKDSDPPTLEPDVPVSRSVTEFLNGSDRVLETALQYQMEAQNAGSK
ncbi:MAG TPA: hypothetical protein VKQ89_01495 [Candidatus Angelobacter sp.]|nr:hypothetical protein [Candidatus Angelobacter sp.]